MLRVPGGPISEYPFPASRSVQDSYVSKGGPLGEARRAISV